MAQLLVFPAAVAGAQEVSPPHPPSIRVEGEILDAATNRPLGDILVVLHDVWKVTRTDELGYFFFDGVPEGPHELGVYALGYMTVEEYVEFVGGDHYAVYLVPAPVEIEGINVAVLSNDERDFRTFGQRYDFVGPEQMDTYREKYIHITDVLRARFPGMRVVDGGGLNGGICVQNPRGSSSSYRETNFGCAAMFIDGLEATSDQIAGLHLEEIENIRFLARLEARLLYGELGRFGVLFVQTRSGRDS
jgi:hypothetical protein